MAGDAHDDKAQEESQAQEDLGQQQAQDKAQVGNKDWKGAVVERNEKIAALEVQMADAAKNAETAEQLRSQIAELKAQGESDRIDFKLQLAGVRNVKAARLSSMTTAATSMRSRRPSHGCSPTCPPSSRAAGQGSPTPAPARTPART